MYQRVSTEECEEGSISTKASGHQLATIARDHSFWRAGVMKLFHDMSSWDRQLIFRDLYEQNYMKLPVVKRHYSTHPEGPLSSIFFLSSDIKCPEKKLTPKQKSFIPTETFWMSPGLCKPMSELLQVYQLTVGLEQCLEFHCSYCLRTLQSNQLDRAE